MIYKLHQINNKLYNVLTADDDPPKLYELMLSYANYGKETRLDLNETIEEFRKYLFSFDYPINDTVKEKFETLFIKNFLHRRIGYETFIAFQIALEVKLNSIMPKYDKMLSGFKLFDFLGIQEIHQRHENTQNEGTTSGVMDNRFSNTPQTEIEDVKDGSYVTDYTYNQNNSSVNGKQDINEDIVKTKLDSLEEYEKFLKVANDVFTEIFKECDSLFFQVI